MHNYYCKNCNNIVGKWNTEFKFHFSIYYCNYIKSRNFNKINFLDCRKCNKFVGILCFFVCKNCFGKKEIFEEEILFNWFLKYKKTISIYSDNCEICNNNNFRTQIWFFKELTFHK